MSIPPTLAGFGLVLGALLMSFGVACAVCAAVLEVRHWWWFRRVTKDGIARADLAATELADKAARIEAQHVQSTLDALERLANEPSHGWEGGRW